MQLTIADAADFVHNGSNSDNLFLVGTFTDVIIINDGVYRRFCRFIHFQVVYGDHMQDTPCKAGKIILLNHLLSTYNDGRKKTLFCVAVNLLEIDDLENIINERDKNTLNLSLKEKAAYAASLFQKTATNKNITLKLRKKK